MKLSLIWRIAALVSLLMLAAFASLTIYIVVSNILALLICLFLFMAILWSAGTILTTKGKYMVFSWLTLLASAGLLIMVIHQVAAQSDEPLLLQAVVYLITYGLLLAVLRRKYWRLKRAGARKSSKGFSPKKPYLIVNPVAGDGRAIKAKIPTKAKKLGIEVKVTTKNDNIEQLAEKAISNGADVIGVSGGDGTLSAVISIAIKHNVPVVVLPGGTRCHFAKDVGLHPRRIVEALDAFWGSEQKIDAGKINGSIFLNNASFGLYAAIIDNKEYRERKLATTRDTLQDLLADQDSRYDLQFVDGKGKKHKKAVQVLVGVNAYETVNLFELGQRNNLSGHKLQVTAILELTAILAKTMLGTITLNKNFLKANQTSAEQWDTKQFTLNAPTKKVVVGIDGERVELTAPVKLEIVPAAFRLLLPLGLNSRRPKSIFSLDVVSILLKATLGKQI